MDQVDSDTHGPIRDVPCKNSRELLKKISTHSEVFLQNPSAQWVFRGQADAKWRLIPAAFRVPVLLLSEKGWTSFDKRTQQTQVRAEICTTRRFVQDLDRLGLALPWDGAELREYLEDPDEKAWPNRRLGGVLGLMQHYGLPTRSLDWSTSPYVAAYMAATGVLKESAPPKRLAVWALNVKALGVMTTAALLTRPEYQLFETVWLPRANNPNLAAQRGLFTLIRYNHYKDDEWLVPIALEEELPKLVPKGCNIIKFHCPAGAARKLLELLADHEVTAAQMFPGYKGAVDGILEQRFWRRSK